jgi:hypothetical protein
MLKNIKKQHLYSIENFFSSRFDFGQYNRVLNALSLIMCLNFFFFYYHEIKFNSIVKSCLYAPIFSIDIDQYDVIDPNVITNKYFTFFFLVNITFDSLPANIWFNSHHCFFLVKHLSVNILFEK